MASPNQNIVYLFRDGFDYYGSQMSGGIRFIFPKTSVSDLDVLNKQELKDAIKSFIDQNQILVGNYIIVVSERVYFEKDFLNIAAEQQNSVLQSYLDTVPFENTLVKTFPIENGFKAVVVNKDLCLVLQEAFLEKGFAIDGVTPVLILGTALTGGENGLSADSIRLLFEKYSILKQNSFSVQTEEAKKLFSSQNPPLPKSITKEVNKKLIALLAIFILLLAILVVVVIVNRV